MTDEQVTQIGAFMQFERSDYEQPESGLGLTIAQKAIELYGGTFKIVSVYHQETTVQIALPTLHSSSAPG